MLTILILIVFIQISILLQVRKSKLLNVPY